MILKWSQRKHLLKPRQTPLRVCHTPFLIGWASSSRAYRAALAVGYAFRPVCYHLLPWPLGENAYCLDLTKQKSSAHVASWPINKLSVMNEYSILFMNSAYTPTRSTCLPLCDRRRRCTLSNVTRWLCISTVYKKSNNNNEWLSSAIFGF